MIRVAGLSVDGRRTGAAALTVDPSPAGLTALIGPNGAGNRPTFQADSA